MRIVSWNACMKFREKVGFLAPLDADIVIVAEAEDLTRLAPADLSAWPHRQWVGDIPHKGLLVMSKPAYPLSILPNYDHALRYILPLAVGGLGTDLKLLAAWTQRDRKGHHTVDLSVAIDRYLQDSSGQAIVMGDLNSNAAWDALHRRAVTHTQVVDQLAGMDMVSVYHYLTGEAQASETIKTHAFRRDPENLFHIDYCFASRGLLGPDSRVMIPPVDEWVARSDHGPLVVDLQRPSA
jgi:hypothetical protein